MVMKLKITANGDEFSFEGDSTFAELGPFMERWFHAQDIANQAAIDAITRSLKKDNDSLAGAVQAHQPAS